MLKVGFILILMTVNVWAQDQAKPRQATAKSRNFCPVGKDYLQPDLNTLSYPDFSNKDPKHQSNSFSARLLQIGPLPQPLINPDCVNAALEAVTAGPRKQSNEQFRSNRFLRCNTNGEPIDHQDEPCFSAEYKSLMHSSFELTTKCLKEFVTGSKDPQEQNTWVEGYFKMMATESGLHVNVASRIGAIGIGQLRPKYIVDFKERTLPHLRRFLKNQASAGCKRLGTELLTDEKVNRLYRTTIATDAETKKTTTNYELNVCSNISISEDQPLLNLIISFANLKLYKESIIDSIIEHSKYKDSFKDLPPAELLDLKIKLVTWSYNLGVNRLKDHIKQVLETKYANKTVTKTRDFIIDADIVGKRNYLFGIEDRYKRVLGKRKSCRTDIMK